jgi:two-component system response regulator HydG
VLRAAERQRPPVPVIMLSGRSTVSDAVAALRAGAANFLPKPFHQGAMEGVLRRVLVGPGEGRASPPPQSLGAVIAEHPAMRTVLDQVVGVADSDASVLIHGETGTGKEVIARLVHASSTRSAGSFVAVNMAAIPEAFAESELFGRVRGAFTAADSPRIGRFLAAQRGTLFFDEIGEIPRSLQADLLRVLQDRAVTPVGAAEPIPVDVRVIAATHRDVDEMVRDGSVREDLLRRFEEVAIQVPPLRERRDDIPALAHHFRREVNAREERSVPGFAPAVMERFFTHDWPGNVRELENLVERLVVVAGNREVVVEDLPAHLRLYLVDVESARLDLPASGVDLRLLLVELEDRLIGQALARTGGNKNRAAELLGMNRTTLVEKLRRRNVA